MPHQDGADGEERLPAATRPYPQLHQLEPACAAGQTALFGAEFMYPLFPEQIRALRTEIARLVSHLVKGLQAACRQFVPGELIS